uniref:Poly(A) polymerase catalytic subunit domain-containing protein n=1 Tax=viral metagenome TaxID=1070528 RepID=A0A6C0F582_9ZZZZ
MDEIEEAAKLAQSLIDTRAVENPITVRTLDIVYNFMKQHRVLGYGGTALNNLLPKSKQFYDPKVDVPDYDFYSETPQEHAKMIADKLAKAGVLNIEVKPGLHLGTFKVFADYVPVADISTLSKSIFMKLWNDSIVRDGVRYVPPNFLRMSVYLELSRPMGNVERWAKVYKRIRLLNEEFPVICPTSDEAVNEEYATPEVREKLEDLMLKNEVVLLGFNASTIQGGKDEWKLPLDLLVEPNNFDKIVKELIGIFGRGFAKKREFEEYGELLPAHADITHNDKLLVRVFETIACHSYHKLPSGLMVASIPTLLNFFFAMLYADKEFVEHTSRQRLVCTSHKLMEIANNSSRRRFKLLTPITCLGKQLEMTDLMRKKSELYTKLSSNKQSSAFMKYFFSYSPKR